MVRSNRQTTVSHIAEEANVGSDRKVSEYKCIAVRCVWGCIATDLSGQHQNWNTAQWKNGARSDEARFLLQHLDGWLRVHRSLGISIQLRISGMCWTNKLAPWRPNLAIYGT